MDNNSRKIYDALPKILNAWIEDLDNDDCRYTAVKSALTAFNKKAPGVFSREFRSLSYTLLRLVDCKHENIPQNREDTQECDLCGLSRRRILPEDYHEQAYWTKPDTWGDWR